MRRPIRFLPSLALLAAGATFAGEPLPVRPSVDPEAWANGLVRVRLTQDLCFTWSEPQVVRNGNTVAITQAVAPRSECLVPGPGLRDFLDVTLGRFEAGSYRLTYNATGSAAFAPYAIEFDVSEPGAEPGRYSLRIEPATPTALEPVTAVYDRNVCDAIDGFRMGDRALEIVVSHEDGWCDYDIPESIAIGSFPPGEYTVRVVRPAVDASTGTLASRTFTVAPRGAAPRSNNHYARDLSGIWVSPDEEPGTAIVFINAADRQADGSQRNGLTGLWYRYDARGQPIWYLLALDAGATWSSIYTGTVLRYAASNPAERPFRRTLAATSVGTVTVDQEPVSGLPRLRGTVDGVAVDIGLRPFRWTRNAWGLGNASGRAP